MTTMHPALLAALLRQLRNVRVDTRDPRCQWFRLVSDRAEPIPISVIWRAVYRAAEAERIRVPPGPVIASLISEAQQRVPLLSEAECLGRQQPGRAA